VLLIGVHFLQCSKYWVMCVCVCAIHLQVIFADLVYVVFSQCICFPFVCVLIMSIVSVMVPYLCPVLNM
jgi:hypothetical protein